MKFRMLADDKLNVAKMLISLFDRVEMIDRKGDNADRKGDNAGYHHFLLFPQCFLFFRDHNMSALCGKGLKRWQ